MVHVPDIQLELLFPGQGVPPVYLGPARNSGFHLVTPGLLRRVAIEVLHQKRPGTHQAHFAHEHVPELGKFVDAGATQELPKTGQAHLIGEQVPLSIPLVGHGAEFDQHEGLSV